MFQKFMLVLTIAVLLAACAPNFLDDPKYGVPATFTIDQAPVAVATSLNGTFFTMTPENVVIPVDRSNKNIWILSAIEKGIPSRVRNSKIDEFDYEHTDRTIKFIWVSSPAPFALKDPECFFSKVATGKTITGGNSVYVLEIYAHDCVWKVLRDTVYLEMHQANSPQHPWNNSKQERSFDRVLVNTSEIDGYYTSRSILPPNKPTVILP